MPVIYLLSWDVHAVNYFVAPRNVQGNHKIHVWVNGEGLEEKGSSWQRSVPKFCICLLEYEPSFEADKCLEKKAGACFDCALCS